MDETKKKKPLIGKVVKVFFILAEAVELKNKARIEFSITDQYGERVVYKRKAKTL